MNPLKGYRVEFGNRARRDFKKLAVSVQKKIISRLEELVSENHCLDVLKLSGYENLWRLVVGDYRVVFEQQHDVLVIYVVFVGHRKEVYQAVKRFLN